MAQTPAFETALALSRFGLGSNVDGVAAVTGDIRERLRAEIASGAPVPSGDGLRTTPELVAAVTRYQMERTAARKAAGEQAPPAQGMAGDMSQMSSGQMNSMQEMNKKGVPKKPQSAVKDDDPVRPTNIAEINARFNGTFRTPQIGFNERMVMFWQNHFAVVLKKSQPTAVTAGAMEREAIRPNVFGRFEDLLVAVETHPCMLDYLDNRQSVGPHSPGNRNGKQGLNENLAREILELHTLGVGTGYTQADVTAFARVITGWTYNRDPDAPRQGPVGVFRFDPRRHEPGPQTIMGKTYAQDGVDQGKAVLHDLARHPATATHIAIKLARHFVADDPPPALVKRLADTFKRTDGDLAEVSRALIASDEAWTPQLVKMRSPLEYLVALVRATGATMKPQAITLALNAMGQPWWNPGGPNGFPDTVSAWASPEGIATRMDLANALANNANPATDPREFAQSRLGALLSDHTADAISRAETHAQGLSLAFLSPEFMRR